MGNIDINDSPVKFSREKKTIRFEGEIIEEGVCKEVKTGMFGRNKSIVCNHNGKAEISDL